MGTPANFFPIFKINGLRKLVVGSQICSVFIIRVLKFRHIKIQDKMSRYRIKEFSDKLGYAVKFVLQKRIFLIWFKLFQSDTYSDCVRYKKSNEAKTHIKTHELP